MIEIKYRLIDGKLKFQVKGHSESAPKGKDLVCAAVSAITIGGLNALVGDYEVIMQNGLIDVAGKTPLIEDDKKTMQVIIRQLETVAEKYPAFVRLDIERME